MQALGFKVHGLRVLLKFGIEGCFKLGVRGGSRDMKGVQAESEGSIFSAWLERSPHFPLDSSAQDKEVTLPSSTTKRASLPGGSG